MAAGRRADPAPPARLGAPRRPTPAAAATPGILPGGGERPVATSAPPATARLGPPAAPAWPGPTRERDAARWARSSGDSWSPSSPPVKRKAAGSGEPSLDSAGSGATRAQLLARVDHVSVPEDRDGRPDAALAGQALPGSSRPDLPVSVAGAEVGVVEGHPLVASARLQRERPSPRRRGRRRVGSRHRVPAGLRCRGRSPGRGLAGGLASRCTSEVGAHPSSGPPGCRARRAPCPAGGAAARPATVRRQAHPGHDPLGHGVDRGFTGVAQGDGLANAAGRETDRLALALARTASEPTTRPARRWSSTT